jgi:epoxyqueuosine reductase QueG
MNKLIEKIKLICPPENYEIGFANVTGLLQGNLTKYNFGLSLARKLDDSIIDSISNYPTISYYDLYNQVNNELNNKSIEIADLLWSNNMEAYPVKATLNDSELDENYWKTLTYSVSHKMIATRAGIGWIGKTDLLVTKKFGPRVRFASVLMMTKIMEPGEPINISQCGSCNICVKNCPPQAANGKSWELGVDRNSFFDPFKCRNYCRQISFEKIQKEISLCGLCVSVCPKGKINNL